MTSGLGVLSHAVAMASVARMKAPDVAGSDRRMRESYGGRRDGASADAAARLLARLAGQEAGASAASLTPLEVVERGTDRPARIEPARPLEGASVSRRTVAGDPEARFTAFLDGIQRSLVIPQGRPTVPVVHGTVGAVVRERSDRALRTWGGGHVMDRALYLPVARMDDAWVRAMRDAGFEIEDTAEASGGVRHPGEHLAAAREAVQRRRERVEATLAGRWCADAGEGALYVDGGIAALGDAARGATVVGVVKSHRTVYVDGTALEVVADLKPGERTTAFSVESRRRAHVASWYLRLREGDGADPFSGIVRLELAEGSFNPSHADTVSRWVLAEREPVALPDARWRVMAYGIRDCETYLRAVAG